MACAPGTCLSPEPDKVRAGGGRQFGVAACLDQRARAENSANSLVGSRGFGTGRHVRRQRVWFRPALSVITWEEGPLSASPCTLLLVQLGLCGRHRRILAVGGAPIAHVERDASYSAYCLACPRLDVVHA